MSHEEFFDAVYQDMHDYLLHYAMTALHGQRALAEEAVQDAFCVFWANIESARTRDKPRGWLLGILKNVIRNIRRSQGRYASLFLSLNAAAAEREPFAEDEVAPDTLYEDMLCDPDYQLLKEFVLERRSIKELAQARGITVAACKKRLQRARTRLKKYFEKF